MSTFGIRLKNLGLFPEPDSLMHYGILGMKWGVRKSQQSASGAKKKRYKVGFSKKAKKISTDFSTKEGRENSLKTYRTMSDEEMSRKVRRMQLERQYKSLLKEDVHPIRSSVSKNATKVLNTVAGSLGNDLVKNAVKLSVGSALSSTINNPEYAGYYNKFGINGKNSSDYISALLYGTNPYNNNNNNNNGNNNNNNNKNNNNKKR